MSILVQLQRIALIRAIEAPTCKAPGAAQQTQFEHIFAGGAPLWKEKKKNEKN